MPLLKEEDIEFAKVSIIDDAGRVFFYNDRVFRAVYSQEKAKAFAEILASPWINDLFDKGLVPTWICRDIVIQGVPLILEHKRFPFFLQPSEYTSSMFWQAAKKIINIHRELILHGYGLKDAHPWNVMWYKGIPYFIDFGSIIKTDKVPEHWLWEFQKYFGIPVWLSSTKRWSRLSREYRRENTIGFGLEFFSSGLFKYFATRSLGRLQKYINDPARFFDALEKWFERHKPLDAKKEYWASYNQTHDSENPLEPRTAKQQFVYDVLAMERPKSVLDCAANKGFYSEMAARLGASVSSFDYEEHCVDACFKLARDNSLDITPANVDFKFPTPGYGYALCGPTAFERFQSDIVLVLGLVHHLCIGQNFPVQLFCETVLKYAKNGVVFEYVDPTDKHVMVWKKIIPKDYCLDQFLKNFSHKFPRVEKKQTFSEDGVCRAFLYLKK